MWLELFNFLHFVGLSWGLGGATIAAIISSKSERNEDSAKAYLKVMPSISKLIVFGLIFLIISGIALPFFIQGGLNKELLIAKHFLVVWVIIIGMITGKASKTMKAYSPMNGQEPSSKFLIAKRKVKAFSKINLFLWYLITLQSVFV